MKQARIPLLWSSDALVVGSTLHGCGEALRLKRKRRRVTLASSAFSLGHEVSVCLRPWVSEGVLDGLEPEIRALLLESRKGDSQLLDLVKVTEGLEDLLLDAGVRLLYGAQPAVRLKNGLGFAGKFGLKAIETRHIVDATPLGTLARLAGQAALRPRQVKVSYSMFCDGVPARVSELAFAGGSLLFHGPYAEFNFELPLDPEAEFYDARMVTLARQAALRAAGDLKGSGELPKSLRFIRGGDALYFGNAVEAFGKATKAAAPRKGPSFKFNDADTLRPGGRSLPAVLAAPVALDCDVLVVGGGTSGFPAALAAARAGAKTVLVEKHSDLGGTRTIGGVSAYWFGRNTPWVKGIDSASTSATASGMPVAVHYFDLLQRSGAQILLGCQAAGVVTKGGRVGGVVFATEDGLRTVRAKQVIDATGDGDLAAWAKAPYTWGTERDAMTMWYSFGKFVGAKAEASRHYHSVVDVRDAEDMTRCAISGRRRVGVYGVGDFPQYYLTPRETRHIVGRDRVTYEGILRGEGFEDLCLVCRSNFDIKGLASSDLAMSGFVDEDYRGNHNAAIPFGAMLPRDLEGLLVIGKAYDASHDALALARMQRDMSSMGAAAGLAAAQAVKAGVAVSKIKMKAFQKGLVRLGVLSPEDLKRYAAGAKVGLSPLGPEELLAISARLDPARAGNPLEEARVRCYLGDASGLEPLLDRILALVKDGLPTLVGSKHHHPDHGWTDEPCRLIAAASHTRELRLIPVLEAVAAKVRLDLVQNDAMFDYVFAICYAAERLASPRALKALRLLARKDGLQGLQLPPGSDPRLSVDHVRERFAYLELCLARAMARSGARSGYQTLIRYVNDPRAFLSLSARGELLELSGKNYGGDGVAWRRWLAARPRTLKCLPFDKAID